MFVVTAEVKQRVNDRVSECMAILGAKGISITRPIIKYDLKGYTTCGQAMCRANVIRLNPLYLMSNTDVYITQTLGHEVAHIAAYQTHGGYIKSHGVEWKTMMRVIGIPASRTSSYAVPQAFLDKKVPTTVQYACICCNEVVMMSNVRHNKVQKGLTSYNHKPCGRAGKLVLANTWVKTGDTYLAA